MGQNDVTEEQRRFGSKTVEGSGSGKVVKMAELREQVQEDNRKANAGEGADNDLRRLPASPPIFLSSVDDIDLRGVLYGFVWAQ